MSKEDHAQVPISLKSDTKSQDHDEKVSENVPLHESSSDTVIFRRAITKSANDLRTIGDCEFRRRSMGKFADTVDNHVRKSFNRLSDSFLEMKGLPRPRTCPLCEGSRVDSGDIGLEMITPSQRHDFKSNIATKSSDVNK